MNVNFKNYMRTFFPLHKLKFSFCFKNKRNIQLMEGKKKGSSIVLKIHIKKIFSENSFQNGSLMLFRTKVHLGIENVF